MELVNHPNHYNHDGRKECWDEWIDKYGAEYACVICLGCADKYLYRAGKKAGNPSDQDINKAVSFYCKALDISNDMYKYEEAPSSILSMFRTVSNQLFDAFEAQEERLDKEKSNA